MGYVSFLRLARLGGRLCGRCLACDLSVVAVRGSSDDGALTFELQFFESLRICAIKGFRSVPGLAGGGACDANQCRVFGECDVFQ